ncbi:MAG: hypothetical protein AABW73_01230 [Nanoarchaeota archaeon]
MAKPGKFRGRKKRLNIPGRPGYKSPSPPPSAKSNYSRGADLPKVYDRSNVYDRSKLQLDLLGGSGGKPYTGFLQNLRLSPPISCSIEDVVKNAEILASSERERNKIPQYVFDEVKSYIDSEDSNAPFSDRDIASYLASLGYDVGRRVVSQVRHKLGIESSYERRKD